MCSVQFPRVGGKRKGKNVTLPVSFDQQKPHKFGFYYNYTVSSFVLS